MIPTGRLIESANSPLDFADAKPIDEALRAADLVQFGGIDHSYSLENGGMLRTAATLHSRESGIKLLCRTTQPAVHIYTGNYLHEDAIGFDRYGNGFLRYGGVCFETQHFPDSPNKPEFPSTLLKAGERLFETTEFEVNNGSILNSADIKPWGEQK